MISPQFKRVLEKLHTYKEAGVEEEHDNPLISVNPFTKRVGAFYEKVRYLVDYKEDHAIKQSAIGRVLKRKILHGQREDIGRSLLQELVSGGYLPNGNVSEDTAEKIQTIATKYLFLQGQGVLSYSRAISSAANEIERFLYPQLLTDLMAECFYETIVGHIKYAGEIDNAHLQIQTYIGCRRSLLDDDQDVLFYALLIKYFPDLARCGSSEQELIRFLPSLSQTAQLIEQELDDHLGWRISYKLRNYAIYFLMAQEIIKRYGVMAEATLADPSRLKEQIEDLLNDKYEQQKDIVRKSGTRMIAYILFTKIILAFVFELPYEKFVLQSINYFALGTNIVFHPFLLFMMVKFVRLPGEENKNQIISGTISVVGDENIRAIHIAPKSDSSVLKTTFGLFYLSLFVISFGIILGVLKALQFNIVSVLLFLFFLTLVSYFGIRIRHKAKKWSVAPEEEGALGLVWHFLTIPIIRAGGWLSKKFSSINLFVLIMDFIIETPFKYVLGVFDSFIVYLKEKREDMH
ncbi:MAG: hypothetical protein NUV61_03355 [Candidatus Azambacteria bacterium]|nr:hypothetical protein [Candidatus Azambacteria bacterium]